MPLYPCVPNQGLDNGALTTTQKTVTSTGDGLTDAFNVTVEAIKALPTWGKIALAIAGYLFFEEGRTIYRRRRSR